VSNTAIANTGSDTGNTGDGTSGGPASSVNAGVANASDTDTGTDGSGGNGGNDLVGVNVAGLTPGDGGDTGVVDNGSTDVSVTTNPSDQPVTADADHDGGVPGDNSAAANVDISRFSEQAGDTVNNITENLGDTVSSVTNNAGDTISGGDTTNVDNSTTGSASGDGGGGGSVAIGGFSGTYTDDWRARCVRVFKDPKKYTQRVLRICREFAKKENKQPARASAAAAIQE
jgi:hypothetical protein